MLPTPRPWRRPLRDKGARRLLLAGRPDEAMRDATIDAFIHDGCDALAILSGTLELALAKDQPA